MRTSPISVFLYIYHLCLTASALGLPYSPESGTGMRDKQCSKLVEQSKAADFNWKSETALSLAKCLLISTPAVDSCVFYTAGHRDQAIRFASAYSKKTIYDFYSPSWFNTSHPPALDWASNKAMINLFQVTSRAYAMACSGSATLVMPSGQEACSTSIWITDEYDAIQNKLSKIAKVMKAWMNVVAGVETWVLNVLYPAANRIGTQSWTGSNKEKRGLGTNSGLTTLWEQSQRAFQAVSQGQTTRKLADAEAFHDQGLWAVHADASCKY